LCRRAALMRWTGWTKEVIDYYAGTQRLTMFVRPRSKRLPLQEPSLTTSLLRH
jgi:hypothetical protein